MKSIDLIELDYLSTLEIIGEGAFDLLQGQITSDMEKVTDNQICLGALCNIKGRVESSFIVLKKPQVKDIFLLIGNREAMKATEEILKKYSPFYKLKMTLNDDYEFIAINEDFLLDTFSNTNLNLNVQQQGKFLRMHYLNKKYQFSSGPFTNKIFQIISLQKNKINILLGNVRTSVKKEDFIFYPV